MKNFVLYILIGVAIGSITLLLKWVMLATASIAFEQLPHTPVAILLLLGITGLLVGLLCWRISPDIGGPGIDVGLKAFKTGLRKVRAVHVAGKFLSTLFTIGFWGSGGFIGPLAYVGQGLACLYARYEKTTEQQAKTLALCALGAVFTTIFGAPLASCLMALELRFVNKVEYSRLIPVLITCLAAQLLCVNLLDNEVLHGDTLFASYRKDASELPTTTLANAARALAVAVIACAASVFFAAFYSLTRKTFRNFAGPIWIKPVIGMVAAGMVAIVISRQLRLEPEMFLGVGLDWFSRGALTTLSGTAWLFFAVLLGRILTTSLTVGSGGSGGLVWPSILIGLISGLAGMHLLGQDSVGYYAAIGIAVALTVLIDVPIAAILLVVETIGGGVMIPATIGALVGHILGRRLLGLFHVELLEQIDVRQSYLPENE